MHAARTQTHARRTYTDTRTHAARTHSLTHSLTHPQMDTRNK